MYVRAPCILCGIKTCIRVSLGSKLKINKLHMDFTVELYSKIILNGFIYALLLILF